MKITHIPRTRDCHKKRVAAYCRVSTTLSHQEDSFETQIQYYQSYIKSNPEWEFAGIYSDEKSGVKAENRPGFQQLITDAVHGKVDLILVKSISRFSRNIVDCEKAVKLLRGNGADIYFEKEGIHASDPSGSMMLSFLAAISQNESESISSNMKWSFQERFKRGEYNLGNNRILGYDSIGGRLVPNKDAATIRLIFQLFLEGKTYQQISDCVNLAQGQRLRSKNPLSSSSILYILRNETYVGDKCLQKMAPKNYLTKRPEKWIDFESNYLVDDHLPIIDRNTWNKVQKILDQRQDDKRAGLSRKKNQHFLYGKLFCKDCGSPYVSRTLKEYSKDKTAPPQYYKAWCCRERLKGQKGNGCKNRIVREEEILQEICRKMGWAKEKVKQMEKLAEEIGKIYVGKEGVEVKITEVRE